MALSSELMQKLLPLLRPLMENESQRRGYLIRALGTDNSVQHRLVLNTPTNDFIPNLVNELVAFGEISPGKTALCVLLEVIREDVGEDVKLRIDQLLQNIRAKTISNSRGISDSLIEQVDQYLSNNALLTLEKLLLQEARDLVKVMQGKLDACPIVISTDNQFQCLQCIQYLEAISEPFIQIIARMIYHDHNSKYVPSLVRAFKIIANQALPLKNKFLDEKSRFIRLYPLAIATYVVFILGVQEHRNHLLRNILNIQLNRQSDSLPNLPLTCTLTYLYYYSESIFNVTLGGNYFVPVIKRIKQVIVPWIDDFVLDSNTAFYQGEFVLGLADIEAEKPKYFSNEKNLSLKGAYLYHPEAIRIINEFIRNSSQWLLDLYPSLEQLLLNFDATASRLDVDGWGRVNGFCRGAIAAYRGQPYY
ncbi:hypothetical protein [Mastigocladopsis repens]|uniref:hypothetical protein n=1 Tax=Mastigocladopsis repens TaxID=221287 RepID=UPI0002F2CC1C|nr:hypothetical protein [Mastigocladopsis repens]